MIQIWNFDDAPKEYKDMSENGGDEDYIAFIPRSMIHTVAYSLFISKLQNENTEYHFASNGFIVIVSHA